MNAQSITNLAYETINEKYSKAQYGEFNVIMDMTNGYINATKLCVDGGKHMKAWLRNDNNKELIKSFEEIMKSSAQICAELLINNMAGSYDLRGTYVHPLLIPHIASWVSPSFAYKVSKIVSEFLVREKDDEIRRLTGDKCRLEQKFDDAEKRREESDKRREESEKRAEKMLQDMKDQNDKTHDKLDYTKYILHDTNVKLDDVHKKLDKADYAIEELQNTVDVVNTRIEIVIEEVVNPSKRVEVREQFVIMKLNDVNSNYGFKVICCQNVNLDKARRNILSEHPQATLFREIKPSPNSKNFLHNIKDLYGSGDTPQVKVHYNYIALLNGVSELALDEMVNTVVENAKKFGL